MVLNELDAKTLHAAIINGCCRLIEQRTELNQINVFPVADGDTGDNMASVCSAIIEFSESKENPKLTLDAIAQGAILGSRGNSGILLTQFFFGLHQALPSSDKITTHELFFALHEVGKEIHLVLSNPVEGTIITLIKKLAELASLNQEPSLTPAMNALLPKLKDAVKMTSTHLKILKESNVVDAGALGFYYFIEGVTAFLNQGVFTEVQPSYRLESLIEHEHNSSEPPTFRYCTEAILKNPMTSQQVLLNQLNQFGDSAAVIGTKELLKIHVHTDKPEQLFSTLYQLGTIKYPKVEDMKRQHEMHTAKQHAIALVTDSSADLPQALQDKYQIHSLALNIHIGEHDILDKYSFEPASFYDKLQALTSYPKTSCITPHKVKQYLSKLRTYYDNVLVLSISSAMSGMHNAFIEASKKDEKIVVLDTKTNSAAHGLLLEYAGQLIANNVPFAEVVKKVQSAIKHTVIFVLVNQFDSMIRSGRMNKLSAKLASWAHIKPIVSINPQGQAVIAGKSLSSASGLQKLIQLVQKQLQKSNAKLADYSIVHADNAEDSTTLAKLSAEHFNKPPLFIDSISLAVGLHAGKGCVALAARIVPS